MRSKDRAVRTEHSDVRKEKTECRYSPSTAEQDWSIRDLLHYWDLYLEVVYLKILKGLGKTMCRKDLNGRRLK